MRTRARGSTATSTATPAWLLVASVALLLTVIAPGCIVSRFAGKTLGSLVSSPRPVENRVTHAYRADARLAVLWVGHATALIQMDDKFVLTDPVFTTSVGQLSKRLVEPGILPEDLPALDAVVISHLHFDHLSLGSLDLIEPKVRRLLVPAGGTVYVPNYTFDVEELATWQSWDEGGLRVTAVPARHNGWRYGADRAWMDRSFTGYVFEYHGMTVYFGGDTGYEKQNFVDAAARFPHIDLALLPIAPIHPRDLMEHNHEDPKEAVAAFRDLRARWMVPIHFDTFVNSLDEPGEARMALEAIVRDEGLADVAILRIGEERVFLAR